MSEWNNDLLAEYKTDCVLLNKGWADDGYGGRVTTWTEGAKFEAVIIANNTQEVKIAGASTPLTIYGVKTHRDITLDFHDVFKRKSDGQVFRITDHDGISTPPSSDLDIRQYTAEVYTLPADG